MKIRIVLFVTFLCVLVFFTKGLTAVERNHYVLLSQSNSIELRKPSTLTNDSFYCYHFTWMGPDFNNRTFKNLKDKTCSQYFKDKKTLCMNPMVATFNGGKPDIDYIRENYAEEAVCRMSQDKVCVKYTVYNNGIVSYETRYCTQVSVPSESPMRNGCVQEKRGSEIIEVCACTSERGPRGICNSANHFHRKIKMGASLILTTIYILYLR